MTSAGNKIMSKLVPGSEVFLVGKTADSVQVRGGKLDHYMRYYQARGLQVMVRFGLDDILTPALPKGCL